MRLAVGRGPRPKNGLQANIAVKPDSQSCLGSTLLEERRGGDSRSPAVTSIAPTVYPAYSIIREAPQFTRVCGKRFGSSTAIEQGFIPPTPNAHTLEIRSQSPPPSF